VSEARRRQDGTWEALFTPPASVPYATVLISATSADDSFPEATTELELIPRTVRYAPGLTGGYLIGRRGFGSPWVGAEVDMRLPWGGERLFGRLGIGLYGEQASLQDLTDVVVLDLDVIPITLGMLSREVRGRYSGWVGAHVIVAPFLLQTRFGDSVGTGGPGIAGPGIGLFSGVGVRMRAGEPQLQLAYHFLTMEGADTGWDGPIGGLALTAGYKLLY
jgi:hypothetical protein